MIRLGKKRLELNEVERIVRGGEAFEPDPDALQNVRESHAFLREFAKDKVIYGINTGFGPMARYKLSEEEAVQTQYNLIRSHASGTGPSLSPEQVKAMMLARLNTLLQGYSGVSEELVQTLSSLIQKDIFPYIPEHGGVGASGDLVQLAHLGLVLIGEGEVKVDGEWRETSEVFKEKGIAPAPVRVREGLAIINGTSAMTGIGMMSVLSARRTLRWSVALSAMINDIVASFDDHFSKGLNETKQHEGQREVSSWMRSFLSDSGRVRKRSDHFFQGGIEDELLEEKVQEYYSLRCVPQILGPVCDSIEAAEKVLVNELNSVNDNPVIDHKNEDVLHGGNFHGEQVAAEMDKLRSALTKTSMLVERQLNYLLSERLNERFPAFLNRGKPGHNFGMQGVQYTATSTVAENQTLSYPMHLHSIPCNNDNQDIVSMGTNAARLTQKVLDNLFEVLAVHGMAVVQAAELLDDKGALASKSKANLERIAADAAPFVQDTPLYKELTALRSTLADSDPDI